MSAPWGHAPVLAGRAATRGAGASATRGGGNPVGPCWVRSRPVNHGQQRAGADTERSSEPQATAPKSLLISDEGDGRRGVRVSPPMPPRALRAFAHEAVVTKGWASPSSRAGAVAARVERHRSRRPCHPRAISSGHQRYPADTHGHSEEAVGLGARS
jgi:hypothetical protein